MTAAVNTVGVAWFGRGSVQRWIEEEGVRCDVPEMVPEPTVTVLVFVFLLNFHRDATATRGAFSSTGPRPGQIWYGQPAGLPQMQNWTGRASIFRGSFQGKHYYDKRALFFPR